MNSPLLELPSDIVALSQFIHTLFSQLQFTRIVFEIKK